MKILWHSNAPWTGTGYASQTALFLPHLAEQGHQVAVSAFYGLYGSKLDWGEFPVYPGGADTWGNDVVTAHALHWFDGDLSAGTIITLMDVWTLRTPSLRLFTVGSWVPVDHDPAPPAVTQYFVDTGAVPIAMSRFGETKLREAGLDPLYVPHGVDTDLFQPMDRTQARRLLDLPADAFVIGMVAANKGASPPRKAFPQVFAAFAEFARRHDDAVLYLHTEQLGVNLGIDLLELADATGIPDNRVHWVDQYALRIGIPTEAMKVPYSAMNVLANPSYGEGFGLPIIEAQACGTPVIVNNTTSMPELCGVGWQVESDAWWNPRHHSFQGYPRPGSILDAFEAAYNSDIDRREARAFANQYAATKIATEYWAPALDALAARLPTSARPVDLSSLE